MARRTISMLTLAGALSLVAVLRAGEPVSIVDAAQAGRTEDVRAYLKQGGDVNVSSGDGMTALHWAAMRGDSDLTALLTYAGANTRARTRLGGFTALHLASRAGSLPVARTLVAAGVDVNVRTATGATPLMLAAASGNAELVALLADRGADVQAAESGYGQTALMFAAARDRADAVRVLIQHRANLGATSDVVDFAKLAASAPDTFPGGAPPQPAATPAAAPAASAPRPEPRREVGGVTRPYRYDELVGTQGGFSALHFAARQGAVNAVKALVEGGDDVNRLSAADKTTALLIATINGQFDIAAYLLDKGADPNLASDGGATPLYAALNVQWAPKASYPQPRAHLQQQVPYLELMKRLLEKGANVNARVAKKMWFSNYVFDVSSVDEAGATPFWRAAYASDVEAMRLLVAYGADPNIPTTKMPERRRAVADAAAPREAAAGSPPLPVGGPGMMPLHATSGAGYGSGYAGNAHHVAPGGMLPAVKYLVDELHADVNAADAEGNTALHNAAARGDNEMILFLVSKGADVTRVNRQGQTTVDLANGPIQRVQPFPETIALLEKLGAKNNHKCVSC